MPSNLQRFHDSGQTHFITFSCWHRRPNFADAATRPVFEAAVERVRRAFLLRVYGYVVMPDHVHLLLSEPRRETLAVAIKSLKQGVSRRLIGSAPRFWQKRYYDFNVHSQEKFQEKLRYIHRNPVKKELCAARGLGVEQHPARCNWCRRNCRNRIGLDSKQARTCSWTTVRTRLQPHSSKRRLSGPPV